MADSGNTVEERLPRHPKVWVLSPATPVGMVREKIVKSLNFYSRQW
jgi:hypothetical protein